MLIFCQRIFLTGDEHSFCHIKLTYDTPGITTRLYLIEPNHHITGNSNIVVPDMRLFY